MADQLTEPYIDFATHPDQYRHWRLTVEGRLATLAMDVQEDAPLSPGYELKLNSYDLGVDVELYDAVQRLRFEHPEVAAVIVSSAKPRVFCAGANIRMLAQASHPHKVNFCKFTNETRNGLEDATAHSGQAYLCAINGTASGGGYELALACDRIILVDDGSSAVSLPELPLLAVLPGTGGLTRLVDKRHVRRDHADFFCTTSEGIRGKRALEWKLIDDLAPRSRFDEVIHERAQAYVEQSDRPADAVGIALTPLQRTVEADRIRYEHLAIEIDRNLDLAAFVISGPQSPLPQTPEDIQAAGASFWPLALARELDDAILHLRFNEGEIGTWSFRSVGDPVRVAEADAILHRHAGHWLVREIVLYWKRTLKRLDVSARSLLVFIEPGSCFAGLLCELVLAADRSYMLDGILEEDGQADLPPASIQLSPLNFGSLPMVNGLTRLQSRFLDATDDFERLQDHIGVPLDAGAAENLGLVTFIPDDIDWEDEVRLALEERASFSPDALTGLEASLRFAGAETLESKIFGRLSAWQNWIFQRPNAVGEEGALPLYGTGQKSRFDRRRV
ncbi:2,3-epoxybenzoyl-CoA dihydrolase [Candidatus Entotheonella palauensis]|uniref:2,3-epoxybenzoyl-CoA dihydrolase n=1 Tax=Candidatus Entotheonella palauensis TaxID=93172 RepID=UPI000B7E5711|nr:2,3-epoxybenzoyl-CoA dihydrolase [Candidatus Entotheonella palauensis]